MADIFGGIQNSFKDLSTSIGNALGTSGSNVSSAIGNVAKTINTNQTNYAKSVSSADLTQGVIAVGQDRFPKTDTGAVASVSPEAMESLWLNRLNKFAQIQQESAVQGAK